MKNDLISRSAAIEAIEKHIRTAEEPYQLTYADKVMNHAFEIAASCVYNLSATQPERKRGKWIEDDDGWDGVIWRCSECDALFTLVDGTPEENEYYFCPHCGADMRGEQDIPEEE